MSEFSMYAFGNLLIFSFFRVDDIFNSGQGAVHLVVRVCVEHIMVFSCILSAS